MHFGHRARGLSRDPRSWAITLVLFSPLFYDCARQASRTGIYVNECRGIVESARPTAKSWFDFLNSDSRRRTRNSSRSDGHYVAYIRGDDARVKKVAIPRSIYEQPLTGKLLVCNGYTATLSDPPPK
jgi:hypothetical protein